MNNRLKGYLMLASIPVATFAARMACGFNAQDMAGATLFACLPLAVAITLRAVNLIME